jgi:hypothetical protein
MIREKLRGFGANVWDLIGNQIIFQLENAWTDSTSSWTVVLSVHQGPADRARLELTGAHTVRRYGAPKLTMMARGGRGQRRRAHRGQNRAARWRGCAGGGEDRSSAAVLGVEQAKAWRSETRSGTSCGVVP